MLQRNPIDVAEETDLPRLLNIVAHAPNHSVLDQEAVGFRQVAEGVGCPV